MSVINPITVVSPDLRMSDRGVVDLVDTRSAQWTTEMLDAIEGDAKKEFQSLNGLKCLAAARLLHGGTPTMLDLAAGGMVPTCEVAVFVEVDGAWRLIPTTHLVVSTSKLGEVSGMFVHAIKNSDLEFAVDAVILGEQEAMDLVTRLGPSLGCGDHTYGPVYPGTRRDVCVVRRMAENGSTYGYDTIYLVAKTKNGSLRSHKLIDSSSTKDYIFANEISEEDGELVVKVGSGGSYSGEPWDKTLRVPLATVGLTKGGEQN